MVTPPGAGGTGTSMRTAPSSNLKINMDAPIPNPYPVYASHIPFSIRKAPPLDMSTVERKGHPLAVRETTKRVRPHNLQEAPTFRPTEEEFRDPMEYIRKISKEGRKYGICKIIPPDSWNPPFAIDTEKFHFRTRRQELNSVEGSTRTNLNYLDQLSKFHKQHGMNLNRFPSVDKRPLDLYNLKKAVETRGGFDKVCKLKKWAEIGRDLGYSGKIMSSLSTSLKNSYQKWLNPYEEYLRVAKPGVQQQLEYEYGGPLTPSPANSPVKRSYQATPTNAAPSDSPAVRASAALNATIKVSEDVEKHVPTTEPPRSTSGFTPVNSGGFTPVNLTPASFHAVNSSNATLKWEHENGTPTPQQAIDSSRTSSKNTPDYQNPPVTFPGLTNGHSSSRLKRTLSHDSMNGTGSGTDTAVNGDSGSQNGRRSKRQKKDPPPTVAGSHMSPLRPLVPRMSGAPRPSNFRPGDAKPGERCEGCGQSETPANLAICDSCDNGYHRSCIDPPIKSTNQDWHCPKCLVGTGEFGFQEGGTYGLRQFQEKANRFKEAHFGPKMPFDPVLNSKRPVTEDDVEREFWRLVESLTESVEVEYGADIHSTTHGSGFPEAEKDPLDPYSTDPWNLNILPLHPESLFKHIKTDISGMTVPWLYVGMCFSTFCWHNEDHYTYSANYQHFGSTKTWYGIPGEDAERFEQAMKQAVPELFEQQPDLLFQLVTLLPPDQLKKAGVNVYALDQRVGQFVITFPQAYHAGFNHGFNFNEAVNFTPSDWEPFGQAGVERLQEFRRQPCFSHDELLMTASTQDPSIKTAKWLAPALQRLQERELNQRQDLLKRHMDFNDHHCKVYDEPGAQASAIRCRIGFEKDDQELQEEDYQCAYCKAYSYLSRYQCHKSKKVMCLLHAGVYPCCEADEEQRHTSAEHTLRYRLSNDELKARVQEVVDRARKPGRWQEKLDETLDEQPKPELKKLRSLVSEGERIPYDLPGLADLKAFVERCNEWVEEATNYITRKQQNRRKNDRVWRKTNNARAAEIEERDKELRKIENMHKLLAEADEIAFDCPEINTLRERMEIVTEFQSRVRTALQNPALHPTKDFEDMVEEGKGFNVDVPEVEQLEKVVCQLKWNDQAREMRNSPQTLSDVDMLIKNGRELQLAETNEHLVYWQDQKVKGELWEAKAAELTTAETIHYHQLEALVMQAEQVPVNRAMKAKIDSAMAKYAEAHRQIIYLYEKTKETDFFKRPDYKAARDCLDSLTELNSKPSGAIDLEKEVKRHEDWMRKGKKLFGKANAPLHILKSHMLLVRDRNESCLSLDDKPRMPVEPASRDASPEDESTEDGRETVFCICRQPEGGLMTECEMCHEWYHNKCLKIARGKIKEDDKFLCPICDHRVKIPRDAARPKLEELQDWQGEVPSLPFQPEEETVLDEIIVCAQQFRDSIRPLTNNITTTRDDVTTQQFYLRKIEGADVLLAYETNFFRQELHKWAPVAPNSPPVLEYSLSTRKPRPTKQQKLMAQLGINNPEDLPQEYKTKQHTFKHHRKSTDSQSSSKGPQPPQPIKPRPRVKIDGVYRSVSPTWLQDLLKSRPENMQRDEAGMPANGADENSHDQEGVSKLNKRPDSASSLASPVPPLNYAYKPPPPISTSNVDTSYASMFTTQSPQQTSPAEFINPSPPFAWQNRESTGANSPGALNSPLFRPMTPNGSGPPADSSLFSPTHSSFAAAALRDATGTQSNSLASPMRDGFGHSHKNSGGTLNLYADFPAAGEDEPGRNEAGEALEGLGVVGSSSQDDEQAQKLADEFLATE